MRALIACDVLHRQLVPGAPQVRLSRHVLAELLGDARQRAFLGQIALRLSDELPGGRRVAEGDQDRRQVADELVECRRLGQHRLDEVRPDAVEHGVAELMIDDVGREAGVDALLAAIEIVELQRLALPVVVRVLARAGVRHDDQPVALESPGNAPPEPGPAFEEVERALDDRPDVDLMELRRVRR